MISSIDSLFQQLRRLHADRQPLNLSAVKRRCPDLVKFAYSVVPFLGWKKALEQAGISYDSINTELLETLRCELCGREYKNLGNHLILAHQWTKDDYRAEYPGAELVSEECRAEASRFEENRLLPHWEALWTPEYALDRLRAWFDSGFSVNHGAMSLQDNALMMALSRQGIGSYDEALERVGLVPAEIRLMSVIYADAEAVLAAIRARHAAGGDLMSKTVFTEQGGLYQAALRVCGGWYEAVQAAGLNPDEHRKLCKYPDLDSAIAEIKRRSEAGLPVNLGAIFEADRALFNRVDASGLKWDEALGRVGLNPDRVRQSLPQDRTSDEELISWAAACAEEFGHLTCSALPKDARTARLIYVARQRFGGWRQFCEIPPVREALLTASRRRFPTVEDVFKELRRRQCDNLPLTTREVTADREHHGAALVVMAEHFCYSWREALLDAGCGLIDGDPPPMKKRLPTAETVIAALKERAAAGLSMQSSRVLREDETLLARARQFFHTWGKALVAAELGEYWKPRSAELFADKAAVIQAIRDRIKRGIPVHRASVERKWLTQRDAPGKRQPNAHYQPALYARAVALFGDWQSTLAAAGFSDAHRPAPKRAYPDGEAVIAELQKRVRRGLPVHRNGVLKGSFRDPKLEHTAVAIFGNWESVLKAAGISAATAQRLQHH